MYQTKPKQIPLVDKYDVIVLGGGPAGCAAAYAAAREGAKTLIIEATGCLGGMATSGLVPAFCPYTDGEKVIYKGFAEEVLLRMLDGMPHADKSARDWVAIDPEGLKVILDDMLVNAGADILFNTVLSDVDMEHGRISAVIASNKRGMSAYSAKVYIDCTGDADLAAMAGCGYEMGEDGRVQLATHCFKLSGVTIEKAPDKRLNVDNDREELTACVIRDDEEFDLIKDSHICDSIIGTDTVGFNAGHIEVDDITNPISVSKALIQGRKIAVQFRDALKKHVPQLYADAYIAETAPLLGVRESRRVVCDYELSVEDFIERRSFDDEIGRNCYYIDVHDGGKSKRKELASYHYSKGDSHGIPYRCLVPKSTKNLLVAGRSIGCDRYVSASMRVMPACFVTGQAAGCAAAIAARSGADAHTVDTDLLRKQLKAEGAYFI